MLPGGIAGTIAGVLMGAVTATLFSIFPPHETWAPARWLGEALSRGALGGMGALLLGLVVHLGVSGGLGTTFALLLPRGGTGVAGLFWGILFALLLVPLMTWLVAPWIAPAFYARLDPGVLIVVHLPFGAALGLVVPLRRLIASLQRPLGAVEG